MNRLVGRQLYPLVMALFTSSVLYLSVGSATISVALAAGDAAGQTGSQAPAAAVLPAPLTAPAPSTGVSAAPAAPAKPAASAPGAPMAAATTVATPQPRVSRPRRHRTRYSRSVELSEEEFRLSSYLHQHRLPFVDALVFGNTAGRATLVELSGRVRTEYGKEDAENKARDFVNQPGLRVRNHIEVNAGLGLNPSGSSPAPSEAPPAPGVATAPGAATAGADPCLCLRDEAHCKSQCELQAAPNVPGSVPAAGAGMLGNLQNLLGVGAPTASCFDTCVQQREHCVAQCQQAAGPPPGEAGEQPDEGQPPPGEGGPPPDEGGPPPD
jgi:hypothetical protein